MPAQRMLGSLLLAASLSFEREMVLLLVCSPAKKVFFTEFRQTSPSRLFS
jgi:hypothetical protein